jgi:probable rRNA maturation factor
MPPLVEVQVLEPFLDTVDSALISQTVGAVLAHENSTEDVSISVLITDDATLGELNRAYRGIDAPTDVLSFGNHESGTFIEAPDDDAPPHLGDIAISYERVLAQAADYDHSPQRELAYLVAHGTLHLLGYDHEDSPAAAAAMREREEAVMQQLGLPRSA